MGVRLLGEGDADAFWRLRLEALEREPYAFAASADEHRLTTPEGAAARLRPVPDGNFVLGAFDESRLCGMAGFSRRELAKTRHTGDVWGVYVTGDARGRGVGRSLLMALIERVCSFSGLEQVALSVAVTQEAARRLYRSLGFEPYGYERRALKVGETYVDEEHLVLRLDGLA